jgi:CDP-paratose 2-epimerase
MSNVVLITGGCGFIGSNLANRLLGHGFKVRVLDDLSRPGSEMNRMWLDQLGYGDRIEFIHHDVRDAHAVAEAVDGVDAIFHFAAQVAVTSSVISPHHDLTVNVLGTFNVLEAARRASRMPLVVFTSTNKVYGETEHIPVVELPTRYNYADQRLGISEDQSLDFHSPYGCSKGSADQYVHDYARIFGVPTVVLRMSCVYGPHQFGNEDQGWVAHFLIKALQNESLTIYGDGKQVRDLLYIDDLLNLFELLLHNQPSVAGQVFNVGGGMSNAVSIWCEFGKLVGSLLDRTIGVQYDAWRPGDQKVYISDTGKARQLLGWSPRIRVEDGVSRLLEWLEAQQLAAAANVHAVAIGA